MSEQQSGSKQKENSALWVTTLQRRNPHCHLVVATCSYREAQTTQVCKHASTLNWSFYCFVFFCRRNYRDAPGCEFSQGSIVWHDWCSLMLSQFELCSFHICSFLWPTSSTEDKFGCRNMDTYLPHGPILNFLWAFETQMPLPTLSATRVKTNVWKFNQIWFI